MSYGLLVTGLMYCNCQPIGGCETPKQTEREILPYVLLANEVFVAYKLGNYSYIQQTLTQCYHPIVFMSK